VYFFEGRDAKNLRKQAYNKVTLYNIDKESIADMSFIAEGYLIAAVDYVHEMVFVDTTKTNRRVVSSTFGIPALVLMDKDFVQLERPFPLRVLKGNNPLLTKNEVIALDVQLFQFYKRYQKYKARKAKRSKRKKLKLLK